MLTRLTDTDDDGTGLTGTVRNNAWLQSKVYDVVDGRWSRFTYSSTGTQNDVDVSQADFVLLTGSGSQLTGIVAPSSPSKPGKKMTLVNTTANVFTFAHASGSSTAADTFFNCATSAPTAVAAGGWITYEYDDVNSRWAMVDHEQGAWIAPAYAGGNFTGNGSMTWTLSAGDVTMLRWKLVGRELKVAFSLDTTSVGGTPSTILQISNTAWGGFSASSTGFFNALAYANDASTVTPGMVSVIGGATLGCQKTNGSNWAASTDTTYVRGQLTFEVT